MEQQTQWEPEIVSVAAGIGKYLRANAKRSMTRSKGTYERLVETASARQKASEAESIARFLSS